MSFDRYLPGGRDPWIVGTVALLVFFTSLGSYPLFDEDEPKNAVCGAEMFARGDWIVPTFNGGLRTDKPILIYWLMLTSFHLFGVSEFSARLVSSSLAVGSCLLTWRLGCALGGPRMGLYAGLVLATTVMFSVVGRAVTPDSTLVFCILLALTLFVSFVAKRHGGRFGQSPGTGEPRRWDEFVPATTRGCVAVYAAMGLAVLAKGPVGFVLPSCILGLFVLIYRAARLSDLSDELDRLRPPVRTWSRFFRHRFGQLLETFDPLRIWDAAVALRAPLAMLVVSVVALPWYIAVGLKTDGAWLAGFLGGHNVGRFLHPMENHSGPIVYYIPVLCIGLFPWSVLFPLSLRRAGERVSSASDPDRASGLLLAVWIVFWVGFFSLARTKLPNYVLPTYPAFSLVTGWYLAQWVSDATPVRRIRFSRTMISLASGGLITAIGLAIVTTILLPGEQWLALLGIVPIAGAYWIHQAVQRDQRELATRRLIATAAIFICGMTGVASVFVGRHHDTPHLAAAAKQAHCASLATYEYFAPSLVFYHGQPVQKLNTPDAVQTYWTSHPDAAIVTRSDRLEQLQQSTTGRIVVLARYPRFLRRHEALLLGWEPATKTAALTP